MPVTEPFAIMVWTAAQREHERKNDQTNDNEDFQT